MSTWIDQPTDWITVKQAMDFEKVSRMEIWRRIQPGDSDFLISTTTDGKVLINPRSMTPEAQARWRRAILKDAYPDAESRQLDLIPRTDIDGQISALSVSPTQRDVVLRRFRIVHQLLNHDWKA